MTKRITLLSFLFILLLRFSPTMSIMPFDDEWVPLVIDLPLKKEEAVFGKRFRTTNDSLQGQRVDPTGLHQLNIMGSGAFTEGQLQRASDLVNGPLFIVDLRQESHAYVNGHPVSWYGMRNWTNLHMTPKEVAQDEINRIGSLKKRHDLYLPEILTKVEDGNIWKVQFHQFKVKEVSTEAEIAARNGVGYIRLYVPDHLPPPQDQVDLFMKFFKQLPANSSLYFHCRGGVGRTTTFMVMFDIITNAKKVDLKDILLRQYVIGGKDLKNPGSESSYKYEEAVERLRFIENFYQYVRENKDDFQTTWSMWKG
ncbi:Uncharacterized protein SCG7109_AN_00120 [Chlamydiales bacterium SCGC AG-110-M15]|nr:Uncharacterized protein SCG7109_AN_00120 [Chlamydiales bacterium SCGC AG-110-M15]